jgi:hypothetical protein
MGKRNCGDKLSNSGELLKLKIPSYSWKIISGWSNYSGKVISLKICESKMDNRGSKSIILKNMVVKEQRVDGSWSIKRDLIDLRCILMGFERNRGLNFGFNLRQGWSSYLKIPSKQFDRRKFSTYNSTTKEIHPGFWSGL